MASYCSNFTAAAPISYTWMVLKNQKMAVPTDNSMQCMLGAMDQANNALINLLTITMVDR
jgi:hypothetical protein